jgi:hypothetical protein
MINVSNIIAADTSSHSRTGRKRTLDALTGSCIVLLAGDDADHIVRGVAPQLRASTSPMSIRMRKLIGTVALLVLVSSWALLAMALAQSVLTNINGWVAVIYYVVAGLGWVLPAMPLISWMARPDSKPGSRPH